ncbi:hypothetical protein [Okeania sp. SIO1F9]|uniref:hypothetical protein n=1 Tax=Okeania sp. SIO1F9 TaxID=2607813 RepID=UPI00257D6E76|nr:hypothetical protein [Okeania sp. SIO1F9]
MATVNQAKNRFQDMNLLLPSRNCQAVFITLIISAFIHNSKMYVQAFYNPN